uniref:Shugoshin C-terminal domain-containing protein n=1 Tax=Trichuris muris TaxID=70415 RepID=A0A5S6Q3I5_TRIMR
MDSDDIMAIMHILFIFYILQKRRKAVTTQRCLPGTTTKLEKVQNPQTIEHKTEEEEEQLFEERPTDWISKEDAYSILPEKAKIVEDEENDEMKEREETSPRKPDDQEISKECLKPYIELNDDRSAVEVIKCTDEREKNVDKTEQGPSAPLQKEVCKVELHVQRSNGTNDDQTNKCINEESTADKESAALGAHLSPHTKARKEAYGADMQARAVGDNILGDSLAGPAAFIKQKSPIPPTDSEAAKSQDRMPSSKTKKGGSSTKEEQPGASLEDRKLEKKKTDGQIQEKEGRAALEGTTKRRKTEATADRDTAAVGAEVIAQKRRNQEALAAGTQSNGADASIVADFNIEKSKVNEHTGVQQSKKEAADTETIDQGVDIDVVRKKKRAEEETQHATENAEIDEEPVARRTRSSAVARRKTKSHAVQLNIPEESIPPKGKVRGNFSRRKSKKGTTEIETADQRVDIEVITKNKRGEEETQQATENAEIDEEPVARRTRNSAVARRKMKSHAVQVNIPEESIPPKGKVRGNFSRRKSKKGTAQIETAHQRVDIDVVTKNKGGKEETAHDTESALIGEEPVALRTRSRGARGREMKSQAVHLNIPDDSIAAKGKVRGNIPRRKSKKTTVDIETVDQGVHVDVVRNNKCEKDEAVAGKENTAVGAEVLVLKRRNTETAAGEMQSQPVEVVLPDDFVHNDGRYVGKGHLPVTQFNAEESGLNILKSEREQSSSRRRYTA